MKTILLILIGKRKKAAIEVQKVLTAWGCMIKTRLGIHAGVLENCSEQGLVILELVGEREKMDEFARKLSLIKDVAVQLVDLNLFEENKFQSKKTVKRTTK